jgi:hypothetical protein
MDASPAALADGGALSLDPDAEDSSTRRTLAPFLIEAGLDQGVASASGVEHSCDSQDGRAIDSFEGDGRTPHNAPVYKFGRGLCALAARRPDKQER